MKGGERMRQYRKRWERGQLALYKVFRKYVPVTYEVKAITDKIRQKGLQSIEVLDIGAGEGSVAMEIINSLKKLGIEILRWDAIDVSAGQLNSFEAKTSEHPGTAFNFYLEGWNEFHLQGQCDFVLARHSWYGVDRWREEPRETNAFTKLYRAVKRGGLGVIVLSPKDNILFSMPNPYQGDTTSEDVCRVLRRIGIKFSCERVERPIPPLLKEGELTEAGHGIFRYMLHTEDISRVETELKECLAEWFSKHEKWVSESELIWIAK